jgi:hypothetical protein
MEADMDELSHWMGTPKAAGLVAGSWCCAVASFALHVQHPDAVWGTGLVQWLASDGIGPGMLPITIAALVTAIHAMLIREAGSRCCREWIDAAWSLGLVAAGMLAWTWALRYEPFSDPLSASRRLAALAGFGALLIAAAMTIAAAIAAERRQRSVKHPAARRPLRRSYEAIG